MGRSGYSANYIIAGMQKTPKKGEGTPKSELCTIYCVVSAYIIFISSSSSSFILPSTESKPPDTLYPNFIITLSQARKFTSFFIALLAR
ncbi:uncharacterized protein DFL_009605 [Arthrobotrys flagrans]|uniref:Uncharacterized protein n=1 Tax=Arthrobotrys flagrans TaxID=97331 RepID=A0A436ZSM7_ARTFL|nr:hypothetical protein DFL_009605 [Arthrobotrys flagrans]